MTPTRVRHVVSGQCGYAVEFNNNDNDALRAFRKVLSECPQDSDGSGREGKDPDSKA